MARMVIRRIEYRMVEAPDTLPIHPLLGEPSLATLENWLHGNTDDYGFPMVTPESTADDVWSNGIQVVPESVDVADYECAAWEIVRWLR